MKIIRKLSLSLPEQISRRDNTFIKFCTAENRTTVTIHQECGEDSDVIVLGEIEEQRIHQMFDRLNQVLIDYIV